jgi:inner membrane protein
MIALSALSMLPDADVVGFAFGIRYGAPFGHRGASHSLVAALVVGMLFGVAARMEARTSAARREAFSLGAVVALVVASHGLLDAMTDGGKGVALLWPFTTHRYFFAWRPIPVAPIGAAFFSSWGMRVAATELLEFAPFFLYALWPRRCRPR